MEPDVSDEPRGSLAQPDVANGPDKTRQPNMPNETRPSNAPIKTR